MEPKTFTKTPDYFAVEPEIITAVPPGFTLFADEPMPRWEDGCFGWHGELVLRIDGTLWRYPAGGTLCDAGRRVRYFISIDPKTLRRADFVAWRTEETRKNIEMSGFFANLIRTPLRGRN